MKLQCYSLTHKINEATELLFSVHFLTQLWKLFLKPDNDRFLEIVVVPANFAVVQKRQ